jgi:formate hydrogenlyase transcriptional activator
MDRDPSTPASSASTPDGPPLADRFQVLVSVAEAITSCRDPDDLFRQLAGQLERVLHFDFAGIVLHDPEQAVVRPAILDVRSMALLHRPEAVAGESAAGFVIQSQQPLIVPDTSVEARFSEMTLALQDGIASFCLLPLTTAHRRLGALGFGRRERATYPPAEVQFMGEVAKLVAVAIENALAFREIAELKDKLAEERLYLESEIRTEHTFEHIVGDSPAVRETLQQVEIVAPTDSTVLLLGGSPPGPGAPAAGRRGRRSTCGGSGC